MPLNSKMRSIHIFIHFSKVLIIKMDIIISKETSISNKFELCIFPKAHNQEHRGQPQEKWLRPCPRIICILTTTGEKKLRLHSVSSVKQKGGAPVNCLTTTFHNNVLFS